MKAIRFHGTKQITWLQCIILWIAFIIQSYFLIVNPINWQAATALSVFSLVSLIMVTSRVFCYRHQQVPFTASFLFSTFTMLVSWRIAVLSKLPVVEWIYLVSLLLKLVNFIMAAYYDYYEPKTNNYSVLHNTRYEWQLIFIRMFVGFDFVPHFCEKLFAGPAIRHVDVVAFTNLGIPHPLIFVIVAGLCEFFGGLALSCGLFTRLTSICLFIYIMVAAILGHHFYEGFIWANAGGGWEYPVLWSVIILSFAIYGANTFSIDYVLLTRYRLPKWLQIVMGVTKAR